MASAWLQNSKVKPSGESQTYAEVSIHNIKSRGGSVWVVCNWDLPVLGVPEAHILYDKALIGQDWSSSKKFSEFNTFQIIAFGPSATPTAYLLENYIKLGRRSADVFMSINVLHPHEFMMKDEKIHVHFMNRLLALAVGPSKLVFMNEQCRITHSAFLGRDLSSNRIVPVPIDERHEALQKQSTSVMFFTSGTTKLGSAPTRLGEALGCGVPVIANEGVGDVADIIRRYNVGVIVKDGSEAAMAVALDELELLRSDPDLPSRCRKAVEEVFSLEAGTEAYRKIYADILGHPDSPEAAPAVAQAANA
jgi:glycosyltransferase involved in cell wall biosynthesis